MEQNIYQNSSINTEKTYSLTYVFLYMFLGILITGGISVGLPYLLVFLNCNASVYLALLIISSIFVVIFSFFSQLIVSKNGKGTVPLFILYTIAMGVLLSSITLFYSLKDIGFLFLATSSIFFVMALYGIITKRDTLSLGLIGISFLYGVLILSLINFLIGSTTLYYVISYVSLAAILLITAFEVNQIKQLSTQNLLTKNLSLYFALQLYTNFIYVFIRLAALFANSKRK